MTTGPRGNTVALACVTGALSFLGCRTQCLADEKATPEQLAREQKAVYRGQGTCLELLAPKLVVVDERVVLSAVRENVLAKRADVPAVEVSTFAPLEDRLKGYRAHFRSVRMADPFEPTLYVMFDPALEPARAATLLATAASAGYRRSRITTGELAVDLDWWVPTLPDDGRDPSVLCVEPRGASAFSLRFAGHTEAPRESLTLEALGADVTRSCEGRGRCADVLGVAPRDGATFVDVARVLGAVLQSPPFKGQAPRTLLLSKTRTAGPCRLP